MDRVRELEKLLLRFESGLVVAIVITMLALAGYNVMYRNVLVPMQKHYAHSGPPLAPGGAQPDVATADATPDDAGTPAADKPAADKSTENMSGFGGGFGGGGSDEGGDAEDEAKAAPEKPTKPDDSAGGFGGGFGEGGSDEGGDAPAEKPPDGDEAAAGGDSGGFGGGFGKPAEAKPEGGDPEEEEADDFGDEDQFANLPDIDKSGGPIVATGPLGGPPPEGSAAAWIVTAVDAVKLDWIDVFLRQLVILAAFLGAAIATARRKHINIDALSRLLPARGKRVMDALTNMLAVGVCITLARAGNDLVEISRKFPREVTPFADDWMFQLMFPAGFGLLALHFTVRLLETVTGTVPPIEAETALPPPAADPTPEAEPEPDADQEPNAKSVPEAEATEGEDAAPAKDEASGEAAAEDSSSDDDEADESPADDEGEEDAKAAPAKDEPEDEILRFVPPKLKDAAPQKGEPDTDGTKKEED